MLIVVLKMMEVGTRPAEAVAAKESAAPAHLVHAHFFVVIVVAVAVVVFVVAFELEMPRKDSVLVATVRNWHG